MAPAPSEAPSADDAIALGRDAVQELRSHVTHVNPQECPWPFVLFHSPRQAFQRKHLPKNMVAFAVVLWSSGWF